MPMNDEVRKAVESMDLRFTSGNSIAIERASMRDHEWQTIRAELIRLTEIDDSVDLLVIWLGEVTTRLEAANALLHRTRTTHYDAAERIRLDADIEAHLSENGQ